MMFRVVTDEDEKQLIVNISAFCSAYDAALKIRKDVTEKLGPVLAKASEAMQGVVDVLVQG